MPEMRKLIGTSPGQVPRNKDLGSMAFQDAANYYSVYTDQSQFRNKIINGDFRLDKRRINYHWYGVNEYIDCSSQNAVWGYQTYVCDQWFVGMQYSGGTIRAQLWYDGPKYSRTNNQELIPEGSGSWFLRCSVASACSLATANSEVGVGQYIEGWMLADTDFGRGYNVTSPFSQMTLSFWVRASRRGLYSVSFHDNRHDVWLVRPYFVDSPNRWQKVAMTVHLYSSSTAQNNLALRIFWSFGTGTDYRVTNSNTLYSYVPTNGAHPYKEFWNNTRRGSYEGQEPLCTYTNATFDLAAVQFERGPVATPFAMRPRPIEERLANRYWQRYRYNGDSIILVGFTEGSSSGRGRFDLMQEMREDATMSVWLASNSKTATGTALSGMAQSSAAGSAYWRTNTNSTPATWGTHYWQNNNPGGSGYRPGFTWGWTGSSNYTTGYASMLYAASDLTIDVSTRMSQGYNQ